MVVRCLLIEPNPESALNEEAGRLFMEDYESYFQRAQLMTKIHATREVGETCWGCRKVDVSAQSAPTEKNIESIGGEKPSSISTAGKKEEKKKDDKKRSLKRL
mmetsp:Transcript_4535/g.16558  ORF Transcript_4535/g.16558 Transcript_4535/m.16558 type:complete len:103 (+) Transcript_4535:809-1117(+)